VFDFKSRTGVVTGGANGIGQATARVFSRAGAGVWIFDTEPEQPEVRATESGAQGISVDVTDAAAVERALRDVVGSTGGIDTVVANAGIVLPAMFLGTTDEIWRRTLDVNLTGAFHTVRAAAEIMAEQRRGSIVVTASTNSFDGEGELTAYNATKAGLLGIVHTAANELGPYGVRVNAVCPGLIRTRITAKHFADPTILKDYFRQIPLGRGGEPEEVAAAIAFLASDDASFITGTTLVVDGGQMATKFGPWDEKTAEFSDGRWRLK